jgi:methionine--tRNA ligase beta chain
MVNKGLVSGWDDPRMPTLAGYRRRGYTPEAIRTFWERVGVAKTKNVIDVGLLEHTLRQDLEKRCPRAMTVLRPLRMVIDNFPDGETRQLDAPLHPDNPAMGTRKLPFSRVVYIEREDFREDPPKDFFRLAPGREVRLRYACLIRCTSVVKDDKGEVVEIHCTWDPASWGGSAPDGRRVQGTLHWVSAAHAVPAEVRLYDRLFAVENPGTEEGKSFLEELNPHSVEVIPSAQMEPYLAEDGAVERAGGRFQFERVGYFCADRDSTPAKRVWNRTVGLKDTWAKLEARGQGKATVKAPKAEGKTAAKATPGAAPAPSPAAPPSEIGIDDLGRIDLRVGIVREAANVPEAQKLIRLMVDLGEGRLRQIFTGLRAYYPDPAVLVGQRVVVVANLKPRQMKFGLSEGMVLAGGAEGSAHRIATFADAPDAPKPGDKIT